MSIIFAFIENHDDSQFSILELEYICEEPSIDNRTYPTSCHDEIPLYRTKENKFFLGYTWYKYRKFFIVKRIPVVSQEKFIYNVSPSTIIHVNQIPLLFIL